MSTDERGHELDRRLRSTLQRAAPQPPPDFAERLLSRTASIEQRRSSWARMPFGSVLVAAAVVVLAVAVGVGLGSLLPRDSFLGNDASESPVPTARSEPPSPEATSTASAAPSPSDGAFPDGNRCFNESFGFGIAYPGDWWANPEIVPEDPALAPVPGCTYFAAEPVELVPNAGLPPGIAITVGPVEEPVGDSQPTYEVLERREVTVDGLPATVQEVRWTEDTAFFAAGDRGYGYEVDLPSGERISLGTTSSAWTDDEYAAHKRVLDLMLESLVFGER